MKKRQEIKTFDGVNPISSADLDEFESEMIKGCDYFSLYCPRTRGKMKQTRDELKALAQVSASGEKVSWPHVVLVYAVKEMPNMTSMVATILPYGSTPNTAMKKRAREWVMGEAWNGVELI